MADHIPIEDSHRLRAACGWLELGNPVEARLELESVSEVARNHPDVLECRWLLASRDEDWDEALRLALDLRAAAPERPSGWIHHAYALRRTRHGSIEEAWKVLHMAHELFPAEPVIPYNLACYACQLGRLDEGMDWFREALRIGHKTTLRAMALEDNDLQELWERIRKT